MGRWESTVRYTMYQHWITEESRSGTSDVPRAVALEGDPLSQLRALHHSARLHSTEMIQWLLAWKMHPAAATLSRTARLVLSASAPCAY